MKRFLHSLPTLILPAVFVGLATFAWIRFWSWERTDPVVFGDEVLLMYKAYVWNRFGSWFAGNGFQDIATDYAPLYSIAISPVFGVGDLVDAYPKVLCLNAVFLSLGVAVFTFAMIRNGYSRIPTILASLCMGWYAGFAGYGSLAMSEALFIPLLLCFIPLLLKRGGNSYKDAVLLSFGLALLLLTRKQGIGLLLGIPAALYLKQRKHGNVWKTIALCCIPLLFGLVAWRFVGSLKTTASQQQIVNYFQHVAEHWRDCLSLRPVAGQISYVNLASGFLLLPAAIWSVQEWKRGNRGPVSVGVMGLFFSLPGLAHMYVHPGMGIVDSRYEMYGRYIDAIVPLVIAFGVLAIHSPMAFPSHWRQRVFVVAGWLILTILVCFTPHDVTGMSTINLGMGWVHYATMAISAFFPLPVRPLVSAMGTALVLLALYRNRTILTPLLVVAYFGCSFLCMNHQHRGLRFNNEMAQGRIERLRALRETKNKDFYPETPFSATEEEYRTRFYLAERYRETRPETLGPEAFILAANGEVNDTLWSPCFSFLDRFDTAVKTKRESTKNPWGSTLAKTMDTAQGNGIVFTCPLTAIQFDNVSVPESETVHLRFSLGFSSLAKKWNISDGCSVRICFQQQGNTRVLLEKRVLPTDTSETILIPLKEFAGQCGSFTFETKDAVGNANGDWVFIGNPQLVCQ